LGLARRAKDVSTPSLSEYLTQKARESETSQGAA